MKLTITSTRTVNPSKDLRLFRLVANPKTAAARRQLEDEERLQRLRYGGLTPSEIFYGALLNNVARQASGLVQKISC